MIKRISNQNSNSKAFNYQQSFVRKVNNQMLHVKFESLNRNIDQYIVPTKKPSYNFTYGNQSTSKYIPSQLLIQQQSPVKSHIQFVSQSPNTQIPYSFERNMVLDQTGQLNKKQISPQKTQTMYKQDKSLSKKKKKLKIFPESYKENKKENEQIARLKEQIQELKKMLKNQSQNISMNQSSISKIQAERTKRLSELNNFNETLYNQLAGKLKQLSQIQYQRYKEQSKIQQVFMESILESSSAKKSQSVYRENLNNSKNNEDFIDIKQFQKQYQKKMLSSLQQSPQEKLQSKYINKQNQQQIQIQSPFLLKENKEEQFQSTYGFQNSQPDFQPIKKSQKSQAFTFHKQLSTQQRHFSNKFRKNRQNNLILIENEEEKVQTKLQRPDHYRNIQQTDRNMKRRSTIQKNQQKDRQLKDFNREIEQKIFRKRLNSAYTYNPVNRRMLM